MKEIKTQGLNVNVFYDFQHEVVMMRFTFLILYIFLFLFLLTFHCHSKLHHKNLVQLLGIAKSPPCMVLEFIPGTDLHKLLEKSLQLPSLKWRLKLAIDIVAGVKYIFFLTLQIYFKLTFNHFRYLHSQTPPICHSDLRAPNIFVCSDLFLPQNLYPFIQITSEDEEANVVGKVADFGLSQHVCIMSN